MIILKNSTRKEELKKNMGRKLKLLDGGFSTQLSKYVEEPVDGNPLWTAKFLALEQDKCSLVHRDFVMAGAEVISTGTYQASVEKYKTILGLDREQALQIIKDSVKLAKEGIRMAEEKTGQKYTVEIAGSVGPYGAFLHDGSEYTGSYCKTVSEEEMITWHRPRMTALVEAGVNLLALETLPCIREALALLKLLKEFPLMKAWISFSIKDSESISSGENFCEAASKCWAASNQLIAVGANCFDPSLVTQLFKPLVNMYPEVPTIVYPNNGEKYDVSRGRWLSKEKVKNIEDYIPEWLDLGITFIGGCCRTKSEDIYNMSKKIKGWENKILNTK